MIKYCLGTIDGDNFIYLTENEKGETTVTDNLNEAFLFSKEYVNGFQVPLVGMAWLPVFIGEIDA